MLPAGLSLSSGVTGDGDIVLVSSVRWPSLRAEYQEVDLRKTLWSLQGLTSGHLIQIRSFLARAQMGNLGLARMSDQQVLALLRQGLRDRRLLAIQKGKARTGNPEATVTLRRMVRQIERETQGRLSYRGRRYKLVVGDDLAKTPDRDSYVVVGQTDARAVLDGMANESAAVAGQLREASTKLSRDWRPPFSHPEGLVLLRRLPVVASAGAPDTPAITPSQMKALLEGDWIEIVVVDNFGRPWKGDVELKLPDGEARTCTTDADGQVHLKGLKPGAVDFLIPSLDREAYQKA